MTASRVLFLAALALAGTAGTGGSALAQTPGLVVDASSGKVLFAERATDPWYPASITKLMTVYVALDQVRQGRATMTKLLTMSENAAAEPPSKLGIKPGQTMTLENALKVIMVKSANDIAMMIGENLGGSQEGFAQLMNAASQRLGMHESRWTNPNGLPDDRQQTSARDMAVLARALLTDFPDQEPLFRIGAVKLGPYVMRNHNGLLGRYPGADGMKTGFICSGGFNVVATATQGGRRLIAVVMGYPSARERDMRTADLLDAGFASWGGWGGQSVESLPPSSSVTPQNMRPIICGGKRRNPQEDDEQALVQAKASAENPIASLFAPSSMGSSGPGTAILGSRRNLGPRVAFEPVAVWLGQNPGEVADEAVAPGRRSRLASRKVRTRTVSRASAVGPAAQAFTSAAATPSIIKDGKVETVKAKPAPASRAALEANIDRKPAAETKPKPGAIGGGGGERKKLGAIPDAKAKAPDGVNPDGKGHDGKGQDARGKAKPKVAAKPAAKPKADQ